MKTQLMTVSVAVLAFSACGPRAQLSGGKQGASEALFAATSPLKGHADKFGSKIDVGINANIDMPCPEGGSATLKGYNLTFATGSTDIRQSFTAQYSNCGVKTGLGVAKMNGSLLVDQMLKVALGSADIDQSIKGKVIWEGACDDFLDIDVTQKVTASALSQTSGGVSMILKGTVIDTEGTWIFDEEVTVTPGKITVEIANEKK